MISIGIDIGGTSVKMAAIENGKTLWTGQSPFYSRPTTDQLYDAILRAIAAGECEDPGACARAALETGKLTFSRWYA